MFADWHDNQMSTFIKGSLLQNSKIKLTNYEDSRILLSFVLFFMKLCIQLIIHLIIR